MFRTSHTHKPLESFGDVFWPSEAIEPILARPVRNALMEWLTEVWAEPELAAIGIGPRKRALFDGAPGVGKTTLAHHLAARLGLPMIAVRPERVMSMWVGETGWNIGALFDAAAEGIGDGDSKTPVVLFLDEFDAMARQRYNAKTSAGDEKNAEVNTLLQRIEQYKGFVIAATNFGAHIDQAIWRRFDMHITLELPGQLERERILARYLAPFGLPKGSLSTLAEGFETASPALMRAFCENLKRQLVVGPKLGSDMRKGPTIERIIGTVHPHPDLGKPRLWALGATDRAVIDMAWPLPMAADLVSAVEAVDAATNVVVFGREV